MNQCAGRWLDHQGGHRDATSDNSNLGLDPTADRRLHAKVEILATKLRKLSVYLAYLNVCPFRPLPYQPTQIETNGESYELTKLSQPT